jgi:hypothetical protein
MDTMLTTLFGWQFLFFCIGLAAITEMLKRIVEYAMYSNKILARENTLWTNLILPILPTILGVVCAVVAKQYPFPDNITSLSGRIAFGLVAGVLSGLVYRVMKSFLVGKIASYQQVVTTTTGTPAPVVTTTVTPATDTTTTVVAPSPVITTTTVVGSPDAPVDPEESQAAAIRQTINK